jgi:16S rRNA (uracil1498-N3)-methyltransferase
MNLVLLLPEDFVSEDRVILRGRRCEHIANVHRASAGDELVVGVLDGKVGSGRIERITADEVEMTIALHRDPPPSLDVTLVIALPRPKVFNRVLAGATSMGVKRLFFVNSWRVEKSYWTSPRLSEENRREQVIAGLEQARDTVMPAVALRRFFRRFVEDELPEIAAGTTAVVAHPKASGECPRHLGGAITLAIGPEGGFIDAEIASLVRAGFRPVSLGPRILRVETAVAALLARLT